MVMEQSHQLMEQTPSPQCVGREFVRQYYTVLNEAPLHLHRFYSHNSSFVHGGVEKPGEEQPPAMGQGEIHKKICSLNFKECHAKIRQVDSQATVGEAVVVQVTGELSNAGQPMRRFMQTFVLVPQAPKQYYVHNDIFRYQDEVFHDNDDDTDPQEESVESDRSVSDSDMDDNVEATPAPDTVQSPPVSTTTYFAETSQPPPMSNGTVHVDERVQSPPPKPVEEPPKVEEQQPAEVVFEQKVEKTPEPEPVVVPAGPSAPVSWAAMLSKPSGAAQPTPVQQAPKPAPAPVIMKPEPKPAENTAPSGPQPQRAPRPNEDALPQRPPRERGSREPRDGSRQPGDGEDSRRPRHPDSHQVFVGNMPHHFSETDLKNYFDQFGKVVDVRINKKTGSTSVPNYGFVVFEEDKTVQSVLGNKNGFILSTGHRLNVEEKKQRGESMRPGSGTGGRGRGGSGGPGRGGPRGGRGGPGGPRSDTRERSGDRPSRGGGGGGGGGSERGGFGQRR